MKTTFKVVRKSGSYSFCWSKHTCLSRCRVRYLSGFGFRNWTHSKYFNTIANFEFISY